MNTASTNNQTIEGMKLMQGKADEYIRTLQSKFHETNHKSLFWNLYIWFPLLQLASFFNLLKQARGFDLKKVIGWLTTSAFFGVSLSDFFGVEWVVIKLKEFHMSHINWAFVGCLLFVFWYVVTLKNLHLAILNFESRYFLYQAYRKYDSAHAVFGPLVEASADYNHLFQDVAQQLEEGNGEASMWKEKCVEAHERMEQYQEKITWLNKTARVIDKRRTRQIAKRNILLQTAVGLNRKLVEAVVEHQNIHYRHLDFMGSSFIVYRKVKNELVHQWSQGIITYDKKIGLAKKNNFFVRVQESQGLYVNDRADKWMGLCVTVGNAQYVVAYEKNDMVQIHNSINSEEVVVTVGAILSQIKA